MAPLAPDLERQLDISVITYNRSAQLARTLERFADSPFAGCRMTVLDNASTDATPEVCREYAARFPRLRVVRHRYNVGLGANFLRAAELSDAPYSWIVGDDDEWDFTACDDVLAAVRSGAADLIGVGAPGQHEWERGLQTTTRGLVERGSRYFFTFTFVSNTIFRTDLLSSQVVQSGYRNCDTLYPQFPLLARALEEDRSVYLSKRVISRRDGGSDFSGELKWLIGWIRAAGRLGDPALRQAVIYEARPTRWSWVKHLAEAILVERLSRPDRLAERLAGLASDVRGEQRLWLALVAPIALIPARAVRTVLSLYRRTRRLPPLVTESSRPFDELRL